MGPFIEVLFLETLGKNEKTNGLVAVKVINETCLACSEITRKLLLNEIKALG